MWFRKKYEITMNRVHDRIKIREEAETLELTVDGDSMRMVAGLSKAWAQIQALDEESPVEEWQEKAMLLATAIFGKPQAEKLMEFYAQDPSCVISVCGQYFKERLAGKIADAQKKMKV